MAIAELSRHAIEQPIYPGSDGKPMADNTLQFQWIVTIQGGFAALYADRPDVFIAGDLLWYPVEGKPKVCQAPDTLVAFGRPKGYRGSYKQWQEGNIAPQVVWEVLSPGNTHKEMLRKFLFYETFDVEEYYVYDPDNADLDVWVREGDRLNAVESPIGWTSPRTGVRFEIEAGQLVIYRPDGERFLTYIELNQARVLAEQRASLAEAQADAERQRAERLAERLRAAGIDPDA